MSTIIMSQCWPLQGMSSAQKGVLISLADQANDDGVCWPSVGTISKRTCLSERAVQEALQWLQATGAVFREYKANSSTVYTVMPARFDPAKAPAPRARTKGADGAPPAPSAPPAAGALGGAAGAPLGVQQAHPTPAAGAPKSSLNRKGNHQGTIIVCADAPKAKPAARATTLPADFQPDGTAEQIAREFGLDIVAEETAFSDYHSAKGTTFKDWQAGFRTWLRNANKFSQRAVGARGGPVMPNKQEALEARNRAVGDAWVAKMLAQQGGPNAQQ